MKNNLLTEQLVYNGESRTKTHIHLIAYTRETVHETVCDNFTDEISKADPAAKLWIRVHGLEDTECINALCTHFGIDFLVVQDILNVNHPSKVEEYDKFNFLVSRIFEGDRITQIRLIQGGNFVMSFTDNESTLLNDVQQALQHNVLKIRTRASDYLFSVMINDLVSNYISVAMSIGDDLDDLETELIAASDNRDIGGRLQIHRRRYMELKRTIIPLKDQYPRLLHTDSTLIHAGAWIALGCVAALLVLVIVLENTMQPTSMLFTVLKKGAVYALVAASLNLLNGFTGLFSLGQAGFMLLGAYTYAILTIPSADRESVYYLYGGSAVNFSLPELFGGGALGLILGVLAALILAGCVAAVIAWLIGLPVLRLKSDYLAIATLGFAEIIRAIFQWDRLGPVTNGANALKSFPTFSSFNIENANGEVVLRLSTFVPFLLVAVCIGIMVLLINSTYGRAFKAIREDEVAAEAMGINLAKHKRMAFCISSFFAGVGGGLFAMFANQAQAKTFTTSMTYEILLIVVIGGIGSISGSCIASFLYVAASEWWLRFLDTETYIGAFKVPFLRTGFRMVVFSIIIMIVVLFFRRGLMGDRELSDVARSLRARLSGKSKKKEAAK